jgi:V8-like Glu-specific endopeptidase
MKNIILASLLVATSAFAQNKVIYGDDNRVDVFESTNSAFVELSKSTAGMIASSSLKSIKGEVEISGSTLQARGICAKERFSKQISAANCSGFLISENVMVTAGHCIKDAADCASYKWVFDYKVDAADQGKITVPQSSVYSCTKILARKLDNFGKDDYAMFEIDRKVTDRRPLSFRKSGKVAKGDSLVVIGHPTGLPTKIADGANVRSLSSKFFSANLDTYGGNSGSAVINVKTSEVEGILVRGENDYVRDSALGCMVSNVCKNDGCRGEDVTYITNIPGISNIR